MNEVKNTAVGPVLRMVEEAEAIIEAIREDNPNEEIEVIDRGAYIRVQCDHYMQVTQVSIERNVGRPFPMRMFETMLSSWAGRINVGMEKVEWTLHGDGAPSA